MRLQSFQAKLIVLMVGVLLLLQLGTLIALHVAGQRTIRANVADELGVANRVLQRILRSQGRRLSDSVRILASDFAFREAVASDHRPTIVSVLQNHGTRIEADAALLVSLDGIVVADTLKGRLAGKAFPFPTMVEAARKQGEVAAIVSLEEQPYQLVLVPVLAPQPIAWVGMGFVLDREVLEEVARLTGAEISVWCHDADGVPVLISTLPETKKEDLRNIYRPTALSGTSEPAPIDLEGEKYLSISTRIATADNSLLVAIIQRSLEKAEEPYQRLELQIIVLSTVALFIAALASVLLARGISRPLQELAEEAGKIARGDYTASLVIRQQDEVGQLASSFNEMRESIAEREEQIRYQATHDELTSLPNRTLFLDRLDRAIVNARRDGAIIGMIMMDLDRFKEINDTLGHHFGDQVLIEVGKRLTHTLRESDTVARLGGDEFAVTFFAMNESRSEEVARRIGEVLEIPLELGDVAIEIEASMGIALYPLHAGDAATLMKRADVAMYDSKKHHRPFSIYEPGRDEHSLRRLAILSELRKAVASGELELYFQPKIDLPTRRAVHAEALVRWRHPVHGVLSPAEFVPLAEQSGNISVITRWVLENAIHHCGVWNEQGLDLSVAVNLSALDLFDATLPGTIQKTLDEVGLPPSRLVLEITESAVMKDPIQAMRILGELKNQGVTIAIDDYGTGYSSLSHLKQLPADELKIDKSFVLALQSADSEDGVIVRSTIDLGHSMGLKVIAEGVETAESWTVLETLGCDMAQGYFITRPLPADEFTAWMNESEWGTATTRPRM